MGKEGYKTSDGKDFRIGRPKEKPQIQEISVAQFCHIVSEMVRGNQDVIDRVQEADGDSKYRVTCWIEDGVPQFKIDKKGLIGFRG